MRRLDSVSGFRMHQRRQCKSEKVCTDICEATCIFHKATECNVSNWLKEGVLIKWHWRQDCEYNSMCCEVVALSKLVLSLAYKWGRRIIIESNSVY